MLYISDSFSEGIKELFAGDTADDWAMYAPYGYFEEHELLEGVTIFLTRDDMDNVWICKSEDDSVFETYSEKGCGICLPCRRYE